MKEHPTGITNATLKQFPEFVGFVSASADAGDAGHLGLASAPDLPELAAKTPEEAIQSAEEAILGDLTSKLLERVAEMSPAFFESLVVDLIVAMGYGGNRQAVAQVLGKSGDEGIDGVVNEDPLGLDTVYIQAKRYAQGNIVGSPTVQQFAGALVGQAAHKGVLVTTSTFSVQAKAFASKVPQKIVLIDGANRNRPV